MSDEKFSKSTDLIVIEFIRALDSIEAQHSKHLPQHRNIDNQDHLIEEIQSMTDESVEEELNALGYTSDTIKTKIRILTGKNIYRFPDREARSIRLEQSLESYLLKTLIEEALRKSSSTTEVPSRFYTEQAATSEDQKVFKKGKWGWIQKLRKWLAKKCDAIRQD